MTRTTQEFQKTERQLQSGKRWKELLDLYEDQAASTPPKVQEQLYYRAGEVAADCLEDPDLAEQYFMRSFKVRNTYLPAIGALKVLHAGTKNLKGLLAVVDFELQITTDPRRRAQLFKELGDKAKAAFPKRALDAYSEAIHVYPKSRLPLDDLEKLARTLKRWQVLVRAYEDLAAAAKVPKQAAVYRFLIGSVLDENMQDAKGYE